MLRYLHLILTLFACSPDNSECLEQFNLKLDNNHAQSLTQLTNEFENLIKNSKGIGFADKCRNFLTPLAYGKDEEFFNQVDYKNALVEKWVELDTMIFEYSFIESENGLKKKCLSTQWDSNYIKALTSVKGCNHLIAEYVTTIEETGGIGPVLISEGAITNFSDEDFNNPIIRRILAVETLLPFLSYIPEE